MGQKWDLRGGAHSEPVLLFFMTDFVYSLKLGGLEVCMTPLIAAASSGNTATTAELIERGADVKHEWLA